jgi:hypothetical protein
MPKHHDTHKEPPNLTAEQPTLAGNVPPFLAGRFREVPPPALPEFCKLPPPGGRCQLTGASRTWLVEHGGPDAGNFITRIRQRGRARGAVFVSVPRLLDYIRSADTSANSGEVGHE